MIDISKFQDDLPQSLKIKLAIEIHKQVYTEIFFFVDKPMPFIAWIAPMLYKTDYTQNAYIYEEGEPINYMYFILKGNTGFVLPRF